MNLYTVKFINFDNELITTKTTADNKVNAKSNIKIAYQVKYIVEVE